MFFIKDLENLSGIKAHHTHLGKRYNVLQPMRQSHQIVWSSEFAKLLNITLLHDYGYKISKISSYPEEQIPVMVREIISSKSAKIMPLPLSRWRWWTMIKLFMRTYNSLIEEKSFKEISSGIYLDWCYGSLYYCAWAFYELSNKKLINTVQLVNQFRQGFCTFAAVERNTRAGSHVFELWNFVKRLQDDLWESMPIDNLKDMKNILTPSFCNLFNGSTGSRFN
jgi:hypothetical protein